MAHRAINAIAKAKVLLLCLLLCPRKGTAANRKRAHSAYARRAMEIGEHAMHAFRLMKIPKITVKICYRRPSSKRRNNFLRWISVKCVYLRWSVHNSHSYILYANRKTPPMISPILGAVCVTRVESRRNSGPFFVSNFFYNSSFT